MRSLLKNLFFKYKRRKISAFLAAVIIWVLINQSITTTQVLTNVPIKIINIPMDKVLENGNGEGFLNQTIDLIIKGKGGLINCPKDDFLVILDAADQGDAFKARISLPHLFCKKDHSKVKKSVKEILNGREIQVSLVPLISEDLSIMINDPIGRLPDGYSFVTYYPKTLKHRVSTSKKIINDIKAQGLELSLNLNSLSKHEIESAFPSSLSTKKDNEIIIKTPKPWKFIQYPPDYLPVKINDPKIDDFQIVILKDQELPIKDHIPISVLLSDGSHSSLKNAKFEIKSEKYQIITTESSPHFIATPLYGKHVSNLFLTTIQDNLELEIILEKQKQSYECSLQITDKEELENEYVRKFLEAAVKDQTGLSMTQEKNIRELFQIYWKNFKVVTKEGLEFKPKARLQNNIIYIS